MIPPVNESDNKSRNTQVRKKTIKLVNNLVKFILPDSLKSCMLACSLFNCVCPVRVGSLSSVRPLRERHPVHVHHQRQKQKHLCGKSDGVQTEDDVLVADDGAFI